MSICCGLCLGVRGEYIEKSVLTGLTVAFTGENCTQTQYPFLKDSNVSDYLQAFGEIKLTVPANWRVEFDLSEFFADIRDKRNDMMQSKDTNKVLLITGNSVFAEIKIQTYPSLHA
jgi:hypothetical protein